MSASLAFRDLRAPHDPDVVKWQRLLARVFANPDFVLSLETLQRILANQEASETVTHHCLALKEGDAVVGGSLFRYLPRTNVGFSGYLFLDPDTRSKGYGRMMIEERRRILRADAQAHGHEDIDALFIDVVAPERMPPEACEREARTMDPRVRRQIFSKVGFYKLDMPFFQLPLSEGQHEVPWLDLLCMPFRPEWVASRAVPGEVIIATLRDLWQWHPQHERYLQRIIDAVGGREVALVDAASG